MFDLLLARRRADERQKFIRAGMITAAVINFSSCHPDTVVSMMDFVPKESGEELDLTKMSPEEQAARILSQMNKKTYNR